MNELFETVLTLSLLGFATTALLLLFKPVAVKKLPAKWQYYIWVTVLFSMIIPVYKFIPKHDIQRLYYIAENEIGQTAYQQGQEIIITNNAEAIQAANSDLTAVRVNEHIQEHLTEINDIISYIWIIGVFLYLSVVIVSYILYISKNRRNSFFIADSPVFENVKKELGINRKIRLKMSNDIQSPLLMGLIMPTVCIPASNIKDENMRMVFLHELTHYKRGDLIIKWLSLLVNALHWFNPLAYLLCANISEACEISCDMSVTYNMSDNEKKNYMKTILDLAV